MDILKHAQNMVARGLAVPFVAANNLMGTGTVNIGTGKDIQWKLVAAATGIGSGFLIHTVSLHAPRDMQLAVRSRFSSGISGFTLRSEFLDTLDSTTPPAGLSLYEKYNDPTTALTEGPWHETTQGKPTVIDLREAPLVIEHQGGGTDCVMVQLHNDDGTAASKYSLQVHGIAWSIA